MVLEKAAREQEGRKGKYLPVDHWILVKPPVGHPGVRRELSTGRAEEFLTQSQPFHLLSFLMTKLQNTQ